MKWGNWMYFLMSRDKMMSSVQQETLNWIREGCFSSRGYESLRELFLEGKGGEASLIVTCDRDALKFIPLHETSFFQMDAYALTSLERSTVSIQYLLSMTTEQWELYRYKWDRYQRIMKQQEKRPLS